MVKRRTMQSRWPEICPVISAFCTDRKAPAVANPGKTSTVTEFNQRVGLDAKFLPGWKPNQRVTALNIVDHATSYQLVVPFFETETSTVLRKLYWNVGFNGQVLHVK